MIDINYQMPVAGPLSVGIWRGCAGVRSSVVLLRSLPAVHRSLWGGGSWCARPARPGGWVPGYPLRFLFASRPEIMGRVLGIVYRVIATHLVKKAGHTHPVAKTGAVTLIQRFGSALNLNIHFHMLFLDGVYVARPTGQPGFAGSRHRPARNSPNSRIPSPTGSAFFWNGRACWSGTPKTAIWPGIRRTMTR